eukprot:TRINITY_DN7247_c0_g1_i1.p1 TRINITY_DN7247_c0_g1~~TRINITY_DN7247_c0_g1_i1.p1  ORF type:complete len:362 (-),score=55.66 TRINITY_DN7247_c0_g1_i1:20-1105(-)
MKSCNNFVGEDYRMTLWIGCFVGIVFSLFGSSFMSLSYMMFGKGNTLSKMIAILAFGDYFWACCSTVSFAILLINNYFSDTYGLIYRLFLQIFSSFTVFWTFFICIELNIMFENIVRVNTKGILHHLSKWNSKDRRICYLSISCSLPIFFCLLDSICKFCRDNTILLVYPNQPCHAALWFAPLIVCYAITFFMYLFLLYRIKVHFNRSNPSENFRQKTIFLVLRFTLYLLIFLICWSLDFITHFLKILNIPQTDNQLYSRMYTAYMIVLQLQGFLDAIVYGFTNKEFRIKLKQISPIKLILVFLFGPFLVIPFGIYFLIKNKVTHKQTNVSMLSNENAQDSPDFQRRSIETIMNTLSLNSL